MGEDRLTSTMLVSALLRQVAAAGGFAAVLVKGDPISGIILVQTIDRGENTGLFERVSNFTGGYALMCCGPLPEAGMEPLNTYIERRRRSDPDLWLIELDIAEAERFAAQAIC